MNFRPAIAERVERLGMFEWIDHYTEKHDEICHRIAEQKAILKIVLKTKNERFMLDRWIRYHLNVVGDNNVIIFDNLSDDSIVGEIYKKYKENVVIARYTGYQDDIHDSIIFRDLFFALQQSCDFFIFLDTDEYFTWIDGQGDFIDDHRIVKQIAKQEDVRVLPGTWLANVPGFDDRYYLDSGSTDTDAAWSWGLRWGKPVYSRKAILPSNCLHNCYVSTDQFEFRRRTNVFIRHLTTLSAEQRIAANLNKLKSLGFIESDETADSIYQLKTEDIESVLVRQYCYEIQNISSEIKSHSSLINLTENTFKFNSNGAIDFFNETQKQRLRNYINYPENYIPRLLS